MSTFQYFDEALSVDEGRRLRKKLALRFHPDVVGDDGAQMRQVNVEYAAWMKWKENPPILVPVAPAGQWASPDDWWSAITNATAQAAKDIDPPLPKPSPAPKPRATAAPKPSPTPQPVPPTPQPVPPTRTARGASGSTISPHQRKYDDYSVAMYAAPDRHGHRVHGIVTILYTAYLSGLAVEAVEIRGSQPRHQIRENGVVVYEQPATRAWAQERRDLIARVTSRNY